MATTNLQTFDGIGGAIGGIGGMNIIDSIPNVLPNALVNSYSVLTIPSYWRAMNYIASNMASFPRSIQNNNVDINHPVTSLLTIKPNSYQTSFDFWRSLFFHRSHTGNGYAEIVRDSQFRPVELHQHFPELVWPFRWIDDDGNISTWYYVGGRNCHVVAYADMIHLMGLSYDGLKGLNPITLLTETFERARHVDRFITRYLVKGGVIRGTINIDKALSPEKQTEIERTIRTKFSGSNADNDVLILSDGATFTNNGLSNEQSQTIQLSSLSTKQIAQITGVPPVMMFDLSEGKYNAAVEQQQQAVVRDLFRPLIEADESELSAKLMAPAELAKGLRIHIDPNALIRGDTATESNVTIAQKAAGIITPNEARNVLGYAPDTDPNADKLATLGGTNNPPPVTDPSTPAVDRKEDEPQKQSRKLPDLTAFAALFADASARVSSKTSKALETASKRHGGDREALTRWGNVFAEDQKRYATDSVAPIFATLAAMGHPVTDGAAQAVGERYAAGVRGIIAGHDEPDLGAIASEILTNQAKANEGGV
jgi:HK97 family phage portal protein